uniref:SMG7 nonsense mediated mRNA decay factor n=1 Tax=Sus scrofa TaxID=9823 RepID=A0A4X1UUE0_PIG
LTNVLFSFFRQAEVLKADMTDSKLGPAEVWTSRQALQDLYQKMLVTDLEYALDKKVEQDLGTSVCPVSHCYTK